MAAVALVPVKRFQVAKRRLAPRLDASARSRLGMALASRTLSTVAEAGLEPLVLAADAEVERWAIQAGWAALRDPPGGDLSDSARAATESLAGADWMVVHADLPLLRRQDLSEAHEQLVRGGNPLAPSNDGGTSLIGGRGAFRFAYGRGSFHRHLARLARPVVSVRLGLCLDLDDPTDLAAAAGHRRGAWLTEYAGSS